MMGGIAVGVHGHVRATTRFRVPPIHSSTAPSACWLPGRGLTGPEGGVVLGRPSASPLCGGPTMNAIVALAVPGACFWAQAKPIRPRHPLAGSVPSRSAASGPGSARAAARRLLTRAGSANGRRRRLLQSSPSGNLAGPAHRLLRFPRSASLIVVDDRFCNAVTKEERTPGRYV
jgi:hypothetical protein